MIRRHADAILVGGGAAGLSLAYHLHQALPELSLLIVDETVKRANDHTWCFWTRTPSYLDGIAYHSWHRLSVFDDRRQTTRDLAPYRYVMIRASRFYAFMAEHLGTSPQIRFVTGTVDGIADDPTGVEIMVNEGTYSGMWAFDSRYRSGEYRPLTKRHHHLTQHFLGWEIETERAVFDPSSPYLFDFRTPQLGATRFFYVLPYSPTRGLVEYALFSESLLPLEGYRSALRSYIPSTLGARTYRVIEEEHDLIPMCDDVAPRRVGHRVLNIGTRGGRVKASSGYAFHRIQQDSVAIAASLKAHRHPFDLPEPPARYNKFDTMLLYIIKRYGDLGSAIFGRLFDRNPIQRIFRFLDEEGDILENLQLMATVPPLPFVEAWLAVTLGHRA